MCTTVSMLIAGIGIHTDTIVHVHQCKYIYTGNYIHCMIQTAGIYMLLYSANMISGLGLKAALDGSILICISMYDLYLHAAIRQVHGFCWPTMCKSLTHTVTLSLCQIRKQNATASHTGTHVSSHVCQYNLLMCSSRITNIQATCTIYQIPENIQR